MVPTTALAATDFPAGLTAGLRALFAALLLLLAVGTGALALRSDAHVFDTPLTEDGYYSLAVARNVAAGQGITVDRRQPTNGFQPLFTAAEAGAFWLAGSDALAMRLVLALSWVIYLATGWLVALIARDAAPGDAEERQARAWTAALLYLGGFLTVMHHFNGLETGSVMLLYALAARWYQQGRLERPGGAAWFGLLLGLLVLTRIDAAVFAAAFGLWRTWAVSRRDGVAAALRQAVMLGGVALAVSSPWWLYNQLVFGSLMPTSGTAQEAWGLVARRWRWIGWALGVSALPTLWLGRLDEMFHDGLVPSLLRAAVLAGLLVTAVGAVRRRRRTALDPVCRRSLGFAACLGAALGALVLFYGFGFVAYWFYYRYLFPLALPATVAIAWLLAPQLPRRPRLAMAVALLLCLPTLTSLALAQQGRTLHVPTVYWGQLALLREAGVPDTDLVAAGQAGTLGFFRDATVNVDGKVNREAIPWADHMWDYLDRRQVRWFVDWPYYVERYLGSDPAVHGWHRVAERGPWQLWRRD